MRAGARNIILLGGFFWRHFNPLSLHVVIRRSSEEKDPPPSNLFTPLSHLARCGAAGYAYAPLDSVSAHDPGQRGRQQPAPRGTSLTCPGPPLRHPPVGILAPCPRAVLARGVGSWPRFPGEAPDYYFLLSCDVDEPPLPLVLLHPSPVGSIGRSDLQLKSSCY